MTLKLKLDDLIDVLREYEYEQECIMDASDYDSHVYEVANIKWHALNEIHCKIYNELVKEGKFES